MYVVKINIQYCIWINSAKKIIHSYTVVAIGLPILDDTRYYLPYLGLIPKLAKNLRFS